MSSVAGVALRSINRGLTRQFHAPPIRALSTSAPPGSGIDDNQSRNTNESNDEFEWQKFRGLSESGDSSNDAFLRKLDMLEKAHNSRHGFRFNRGDGSRGVDDLDESFNSLNDGMDGKLKKAGTYFEFDPEEIGQPDYSFRPDRRFVQGTTYDIKDLDLRRPSVTKFPKPAEFEVTTKEALKKADFRNVRFLANFITEAGIIIKRSKTGIRAKAQRKVAREIKTARAFGLMPFTTMGTKSFVYGRSMENLEKDFSYQSYDNFDVADEYVGGDHTYDGPAAKDGDGDGDRNGNGPVRA